MPLHTDYRPNRLDDFVGNTETVEALKIHLKKRSPNRSILFVGPSGCGKTTLGICVANELGSYDQWNFKILNTSDFRGIDTIRDIREEASRRPLGSAKNRVWMMDECHKLTPDAQEALLRLIEEPPNNCWFMFGTTNPEKLKVTMKRRCTEFQVSPLSDRELSGLMYRILKEEKKRIPREIVSQIIRDSFGSCGMALNILDKIVDLPEDQMSVSARRWAEKTDNVISLCRTMLKAIQDKAKWQDVVDILKTMQEEDPETVRRQVLEYFNKVALDGEEKAYMILCCFKDPYYDCGRSGLFMSAYDAFTNK